MKKHLNLRPFLLVWLTLCGVLASSTSSSLFAITIEFDYTYDTNGFFNSQTRRDTLEAAADEFEIFTDSLTAITPTGQNTWTLKVHNPSNVNGAQISIVDKVINGNTVVIYLGGDDLSGNTLGSGGSGGFSAVGLSSFFDSLRRGQPNSSGSNATDFGSFGGFISFDINSTSGAARNWHDNHTTMPTPGENDLLSVARHELMHVFGFGGSDSYSADLNLNNYTHLGNKVQQIYEGIPAIDSGGGSHWASSVKSYHLGAEQTALMVPAIFTGSRRGLTELDYAALEDIGWQVPASIYALHAQSSSLPGDYNNDGLVNNTDFTIWKNSFGSTSNLQADGNANGVIDAADFTVWRDHFTTAGSGSNVGTSVLETAPVPEPATWILSLISLTLVLWLRMPSVRNS